MFRNGAVVALSVLVFGVAALVPKSCLAQSQDQSVPNFSGAWELVEIKGAMGLKPTDARFGKLMLVISHEGSQLRITQKRTRRGTLRVTEYSYYTDGRGETNIGRIDSFPYERKTESVSGWKQERLLITYSTDSSLLSPDRGVSRKDEWRLGSNSTLVLTITTVGPEPGYPGGNGTGTAGLSGYGKRKFIFRGR